MASGGASAHCCPGALHAWPKVSAPTARAPARWRRSTAGVDGRSGVAPVAFRRKSRSEKWRRRQRDENAFSGIRRTAASHAPRPRIRAERGLQSALANEPVGIAVHRYSE